MPLTATKRTLEEAALYPAALDVVREKVKPFRDKNRDHGFRTYWWRFGRPRGDMRRAIDPLSRYIAGNRVGKRFLFTWVDKEVCAGDATNIFAFEDDYAMGILMSSTHQTWARAEASTLRVDLRYTPTSCFQTFPWPDATESQREEIASAIRNLLERRRAICVERDIGLTELYNFVEEGGFRDLAALHDRLDKSVAAAYGWPSSVASDPLEIRVRLAALHAEALAGASLV